MIQTLRIQNVALIDSAVLDFVEGLNVISGETGAGKSILLDSLSFVFGGRADKSLIRSGERSMKVEAIFSSVNKKHGAVAVLEVHRAGPEALDLGARKGNTAFIGLLHEIVVPGLAVDGDDLAVGFLFVCHDPTLLSGQDTIL